MKVSGWTPIPVGAVALSDSEMKDLRTLGVADIPNLKLPKDLADQIQLAQVDATKRKLGIPPGTVGANFDPKDVVPIESLPQAHKDALKKYIMDSQTGLAAQEEVKKQVSVMVPNNPNILPGLTKAMEVAAAASKPSVGQVTTPIQQTPAAPPPVVTRPGVFKSVEAPSAALYKTAPAEAPNNPPKVVVPEPSSWTVQPPVQAAPQVPAPPPFKIEEPAAGQPAPTATQEAVAASTRAMEDMTSPALRDCPRCRHNLVENKMVEEPTMNDLIEYRASCIIGGHRYYKEYLLFGGLLRVNFRTLTQKEEDAILAQVMRDQAQAAASNDILIDDYVRGQHRYRMACSLEAVTRGEEVFKLSSLDEWDPERTVDVKVRVRDFYAGVVGSVLTSSSLFGTINECFENFHAYVLTMELRANDPKSYPTTQPQ